MGDLYYNYFKGPHYSPPDVNIDELPAPTALTRSPPQIYCLKCGECCALSNICFDCYVSALMSRVILASVQRRRDRRNHLAASVASEVIGVQDLESIIYSLL